MNLRCRNCVEHSADIQVASEKYILVKGRVSEIVSEVDIGAKITEHLTKGQEGIGAR